MSEKNQNPSALYKIFSELNVLSESNRLKDLPRRIELCKQALTMISKEDQLEIWGELQNDLACNLLKTPTGAHAENIEEALQHFHEALKVRTRLKYPKEWGITLDNLGTAYQDRIAGDRAENIETAIHHYTQALEVRTRESDPERWAMTQRNLADAYCVRLRGKRMENLEQALRYANQALEVFVYALENNQYNWAQAQSTLGEIYRVREPRKENIEQSIWHFNQALKGLTLTSHPNDWAMLQQNLGAAYIDRIDGAQVQNIEQAIHYCQQALELYTRESFPQDWASLQHNLGNAYRLRIHGDRAENIEQSILHFQYALEVRTRLAFPEHWARTQSELGNTYQKRIRDDREKNIEKAIYHHQQALTVYTRQAFAEHWARTCNNLGNAYLARIQGKCAETNEELESAKQAIFYYEQALTVRNPGTWPEDWAETQSNLAGAERIRASDEDLENAFERLQLVLTVYTRQDFPPYWARTHNNLAIICADRKRVEPEKNIKQAIWHYQQALEVYTLKEFPEECLKTARGLGKLTFDEQQWSLAKDAYDTVLMAQDVLMHGSFSSASEKAELYEVQNLPPRAAYAHVKSGNVKRAVEVLEKGRAQLLRESFELQEQKLKQLPTLGFENLCNDYIKARNAYQALQSLKQNDDEHPVDWEQALKKTQAAATAIREEAGRIYPEYRYFMKSLSFDEIQEQAGESPLIYLIATHAGGLALVVSKQDVQVIEFPELEQESLQKQIWHPSNEEIDRVNLHLQRGVIEMEDIQAVKGGFFSMYALWNLTSYLVNTSGELKSQLFMAWQETLDQTTRWLWDTVMERLITLLKEYGESAVLIPAGQLALLPLHAAWTEDSSKPTKRRYVLDELNMSYAPSAHSLRQASLAANRPAKSLLVVDNPDGSLSYSSDEVQAVMDGFGIVTDLVGEMATVEQVKDEMQKAQVLHFSTHGRAGWEKAEQARLKLADGDLTMTDIFTLDLNRTRLAVLSACETGVPGLELIDEMIGLPAGMLQAGVPGVVGSLWSVSDQSTALLMARFYRFWRRDGKTPQEALRQAQIWLRDRLIKFKSPYYWAAFTYTGF